MLTLEQAKSQVIEILTDASGVTINNEIIFDLADSNGLKDLIKNSMIKDKLLASPELLLKKDTTLYMYDASVVDIKVKPEGIEIDWHDSITSMLPDADAEETEADADKLKKNAERTARKRRLLGSQASSTVASSTVSSDDETDESVHPMPVGIAPRRTKEAENYWPFMVCKAIIRKLHGYDHADKPNFRSYYSVLDFLARKYNMCIDRLIKTNPIDLIPFDTLKGILSSRTCEYLLGRKEYEDRYLKRVNEFKEQMRIMQKNSVKGKTLLPFISLNDIYRSKTERATEIIKRMSTDSTGDLDSIFEIPRFITVTLPDSAT